MIYAPTIPGSETTCVYTKNGTLLGYILLADDELKIAYQLCLEDGFKKVIRHENITIKTKGDAE